MFAHHHIWRFMLKKCDLETLTINDMAFNNKKLLPHECTNIAEARG